MPVGQRGSRREAIIITVVNEAWVARIERLPSVVAAAIIAAAATVVK